MTGELPLIGLLRGPDTILERDLLTFGDEEEAATKAAVRWAWDRRRVRAMSQHEAAKLMGIPASHFSCILNGQKHLPVQKRNAFEWVVGNKAVSQTMDRFALIREREMTTGLAKVIAEQMVRAA